MKKKIIVGAVILAVAVALTIVFVNLFKDRTTTAVSNTVIEYTQSKDKYLSRTTTKYNTLNGYLNDLKTATNTAKDAEGISDADARKYGTYLIEIENVQKSYSVYIELADFYARNIFFTSYNKVYTKNQKTVRDSFSNADKCISNMVKYIDENDDAMKDQWLLMSWENLRSDAENFIEINNKAFESLTTLYIACADGVMDNEFTHLTLNTIVSNLKKIKTNYSISNTDVTLASKLVNSYCVKSYKGFANYFLDTELQTKVDMISNNGQLADQTATNADIRNTFLSGSLNSTLGA